jgi:5'-3' exonuclease
VMIALLDADILCYRVGFATNDEHENTAIETMAVVLEDLIMFDLIDCEEHELFLTGKTNFRHDVAVTEPYKGNRKDVKKPTHLPLLREYLQTAWGASVSDGQEADDDIAIRATELGEESIIVSIDKDFMQVPGWHYNFVKREKKFVTPEEGLRFFYKQILTGDAADNVKGLHRVGDVKATKMLADAKTEKELYACCVEAMGVDRVLENARLLWLRRQPNQMWEPPNEEE